MKNFKNFILLFAAISFVISLTACGVSKEEHQKVASELEKTKTELDNANTRIAQFEKGSTKIAELEKVLRQKDAELKSAKSAKEEKPQQPDQGLLNKLSAAQQESGSLKEKVAALTKENSTLKNLIENLKTQIAGIQEKFKGLQGQSGGSITDLLKGKQ